jgi:hypothetical protein
MPGECAECPDDYQNNGDEIQDASHGVCDLVIVKLSRQDALRIFSMHKIVL